MGLSGVGLFLEGQAPSPILVLALVLIFGGLMERWRGYLNIRSLLDQLSRLRQAQQSVEPTSSTRRAREPRFQRRIFTPTPFATLSPKESPQGLKQVIRETAAITALRSRVIGRVIGIVQSFLYMNRTRLSRDKRLRQHDVVRIARSSASRRGQAIRNGAKLHVN